MTQTPAAPSLEAAIRLHQQGRFADAEPLYRAILRLTPDDPEAAQLLGVLFHQQGRHLDAVDLIRRALRSCPRNAVFHSNLALALRALGEHDEAAEHLVAAIGLEPGYHAARRNLAVVLQELGRHAEAVPHLEEVARVAPQDAAALRLLGSAYQRAGRLEDAYRVLSAAAEIQPDDALRRQLISLAGDLGRADHDGIPVYRTDDGDRPATAEIPDLVERLCRTLDDAPEETRAARMAERLLDSGRLPDSSHRLFLHRALARAHDRAGRADEAFAHAMKAAALTDPPADETELIDAVADVFHPSRLDELPTSGLETEVPVFVVGAPGSGVEYVRDVLAAHPAVTLADSGCRIADLTDRLPDALGADEGYPACLKRLDQPQLARLAVAHMQRLRAADESALRVVGADPSNRLHLGFLSLLFPNARVVHCRRDARDAYLASLFAGDSREPDAAAHSYRCHERLMDVYRRAMPLPMLEVSCEEMAADPARWTRELVAFMGLDWHDACAAVAPPEPVARHRYEAHLGDFEKAEPAPPTTPSMPVAAAEEKSPPFDAGPLLREGVEHHHQGRTAEARSAYAKILAADPAHAEALHLTGVSYYQERRADDAIPWIRRAIEQNPREPSYHANHALALWASHRGEEAIAAFTACLDLQPANVTARKNLALILRDMGRPAEAASQLAMLADTTPDDPAAWKSLGVALTKLMRYEEAHAAFDRQLTLDPKNAEAWNNLGVACKELGRLDEAEAHYRRGVSLKHDSPELHNNLGVLLHARRQTDAALSHYDEAIRHKPSFADAHAGKGVALAEVGRHDEAIACFERALKLDGRNPDFHSSLGGSMQLIGELDRAMACFDEALKLDPHYFWAHFNRSQVLLLQGKFREGWPEYEWRFRKPGHACEHSEPVWDGTKRPESTLLLHAEQGLGDTLMCLRFADVIRSRVGKVVVEVQPQLLPLLGGYPGADLVVASGRPRPPCDVRLPMMSAPGILGLAKEQIPAPPSYLRADPALIESWRQRLAGIKGRRVGVAWQGNPKYGHDHLRSVPLSAFAPLASVPGVTLISLQKGHGVEQLSGVTFPVVDLGSEVDRAGAFVDTAAILTNLDLLITSDSAIAHLAGALGVTVWLATSFVPDWRWLREGDSSPWYPTMRLFRQPRRGEWGAVFAAMRDALAAMPATAPAAVPAGKKASYAVEISAGELLDKITILRIRCDRVTDAERLRPAREELLMLEAVRRREVPESEELSRLFDALRAVNERLWDIEDEIRTHERNRQFGASFVALARSVYWTNDERGDIKRRVNELLGSAHAEVKQYAEYR